MDNKTYRDNMLYSQKPMRHPELAEAYVPFQVMEKVYKPREALCKGTLFPELYKPYKIKKK